MFLNDERRIDPLQLEIMYTRPQGGRNGFFLKGVIPPAKGANQVFNRSAAPLGNTRPKEPYMVRRLASLARMRNFDEGM